MAETDNSGDVKVKDEPTTFSTENDVEESMEVTSNNPAPIETICTTGTGDSIPTTINNNNDDQSLPYDDFKLFIGGLSHDTNKQLLEEYFGKYGTIVDINLKLDPNSGKSKGFAFVLFKEDNAVDKVIQEGPHVLSGKEVDAKKAIPHEVYQNMKNKTKKVFVGGVPIDMDKSVIRTYFETFGEIEEVALVTEKNEERKRRGFCFVTFISEDTADKVCANTFHTIQSTKVEVKRATPRESDKRSGRGGGGRGHQGLYPAGGRGMPISPYGGHAFYQYLQPPHGYPNNAYMGGYPGYGPGYGGYPGAYDVPPYGGGRRDDSNYNSRYGGPMRSYAHGGHNVPSFHPYSR